MCSSDLAGLQGVHHGVDLDALFHAEGADDDVLVGEVLDLFLGQLLHLDVVVEEGVVFGELLQLAVTDAINAGIADVGDEHVFVDDEHRDEGGAHAPELRVALGVLEDAQVGQLDAGDEAVFFVAPSLVHLVWPGGFGVGAGCAEEIPQGLDGQIGGDFARGVPAHSVGDDVEVILIDDGESVLVMSTLHADICLTGDDYTSGQRTFSSMLTDTW